MQPCNTKRRSCLIDLSCGQRLPEPWRPCLLGETRSKNVQFSCGPRLTRQDFLRAALALAAVPLLRRIPVYAAAPAPESVEVSEIAPGVFVHQGRYEMQSPGKSRRHGQCGLRHRKRRGRGDRHFGQRQGWAGVAQRHPRRDEQADPLCDQHAYASGPCVRQRGVQGG